MRGKEGTRRSYLRDLINTQNLNGASLVTNTYYNFLIAILIASSACLASAQSQPPVATITGEIRDPTSREITFSYQPPSALGSAEERVVLDSLNRFALEIPVVRGALARGHLRGRAAAMEMDAVDWYFLLIAVPSSSSSNPATVCT